jgi:uncharacterized membrane protein YkvA (DUF1232 family)
MRIMTRIIDWFAAPYSLYLLLRDPHIDWKVKLKAGLILAAVTFYILNPADLIPDFTPVLGWIDDLVIVPLAMALAAKVVPGVNLAEIRQRARAKTRRVMLWTIAFIGVMVVISLSTLGLVIYLAIRAWS